MLSETRLLQFAYRTNLVAARSIYLATRTGGAQQSRINSSRTTTTMMTARSTMSEASSLEPATTRTVPVLPCSSSLNSLPFHPSSPPHHPLQSPRLDTSLIPTSTLQHLQTASAHLHAERLVAIPTETVYGLGASTQSALACRRVYALKGRPSDNPLIVHVSSLDMLLRLTPEEYTIPDIYIALISEFWPGPLTLLFPSRNPPPAPAPQTVAVRFPAHPLARALISLSDLPVSAPSANSSGRPSPTEARHVAVDLGMKGALPDQHQDEQGVLGCILDAGPCTVGVESTVLDATSWTRRAGGGTVKVLRPGGVGVERIEEVVKRVDGELGTRTGVWVYGRDAPIPDTDSKKKQEHENVNEAPATPRSVKPVKQQQGEISNPSTPGMKYKHYSPSIPVYLLYPSDAFTTTTSQGVGGPDDVGPRTVLFINKSPSGGDVRPGDDHHRLEVNGKERVESGEEVKSVLSKIAHSVGKDRRARLGVMAFEGSGLRRKIQQTKGEWDVEWVSLGETVEDAARNLFGGMLALEGKRSDEQQGGNGIGVDAIVIEATNTYGLGLAFMERAGKAVGGGGGGKGLGLGLGANTDASGEVKRFLVDVE